MSSLLSSSLLFSARQRMMEALERERALMAVLMDTVPDHIYFKDECGRFVLINASMAKTLGVGDPAEAIGKTDFDFFTPEHAQPALDAEQEIMRSGQPIVDLEEKETWPDGHVTWVSTTKMPLRDAKGGIIGTFGLSKDITEHRRAEERILRLAALVESSRDAIFGVDMQDLVTSWNKGAEEVYGYGADEMVGKPISLLMTAEERNATIPVWEKARTGEEIRRFESTGRKKNGTSIPLSYALAPIREEQGKIVGIAVIARDLTEEKAIQARLIQAQRLESLGTLAGGIAHQFNNINTVIQGYLDVLLRSPGISPSTRSYGEEALKGVDRLVHITAQLQGLTGSSEPGMEICQLNLLIPSLLRDFEKKFEKRKVSVVLEMQETPPVRVHRSRAGFILTSLIDNSLDAMLDRPVQMLTIRTGGAPKFAFLEVRDTGCGIPREDIPRLFTPFFTTKGEWAASGSCQAKVKGEGLSLSVCRSTVSESGGRIEVDSEPGVGTTFRVWLPTIE
ncbi:MAG: PAS domain S-box protein [Spirochaetia bacterium]